MALATINIFAETNETQSVVQLVKMNSSLELISTPVTFHALARGGGRGKARGVKRRGKRSVGGRRREGRKGEGSGWR